ncbi:unnamed protein product [Caenorhabditis sp. 36 PRJEB53466]|nr:unnamed protein product [Caenorhabditis sp. 36 PRJEB53466]
MEVVSDHYRRVFGTPPAYLLEEPINQDTLLQRLPEGMVPGDTIDSHITKYANEHTETHQFETMALAENFISTRCTDFVFIETKEKDVKYYGCPYGVGEPCVAFAKLAVNRGFAAVIVCYGHFSHDKTVGQKRLSSRQLTTLRMFSDINWKPELGPEWNAHNMVYCFKHWHLSDHPMHFLSVYDIKAVGFELDKPELENLRLPDGVFHGARVPAKVELQKYEIRNLTRRVNPCSGKDHKLEEESERGESTSGPPIGPPPGFPPKPGQARAGPSEPNSGKKDGKEPAKLPPDFGFPLQPCVPTFANSPEWYKRSGNCELASETWMNIHNLASEIKKLAFQRMSDPVCSQTALQNGQKLLDLLSQGLKYSEKMLENNKKLAIKTKLSQQMKIDMDLLGQQRSPSPVRTETNQSSSGSPVNTLVSGGSDRTLKAPRSPSKPSKPAEPKKNGFDKFKKGAFNRTLLEKIKSKSTKITPPLVIPERDPNMIFGREKRPSPFAFCKGKNIWQMPLPKNGFIPARYNFATGMNLKQKVHDYFNVMPELSDTESEGPTPVKVPPGVEPELVPEMQPDPEEDFQVGEVMFQWEPPVSKNKKKKNKKKNKKLKGADQPLRHLDMYLTKMNYSKLRSWRKFRNKNFKIRKIFKGYADEIYTSFIPELRLINQRVELAVGAATAAGTLDYTNESPDNIETDLYLRVPPEEGWHAGKPIGQRGLRNNHSQQMKDLFKTLHAAMTNNLNVDLRSVGDVFLAPGTHALQAKSKAEDKRLYPVLYDLETRLLPRIDGAHKKGCCLTIKFISAAKPTIVWAFGEHIILKGNRDLDQKMVLGSPTNYCAFLFIDLVQDITHGQYYVYIGNKYGCLIPNFVVVGKDGYHPKAVGIPFTITEGSPDHVYCGVMLDNIFPGPVTIQWTRDDVRLTEKEKKNVITSTRFQNMTDCYALLEVKSRASLKPGRYVCEVSNGIGVAQFEVDPFANTSFHPFFEKTVIAGNHYIPLFGRRQIAKYALYVRYCSANRKHVRAWSIHHSSLNKPGIGFLFEKEENKRTGAVSYTSKVVFNIYTNDENADGRGRDNSVLVRGRIMGIGGNIQKTIRMQLRECHGRLTPYLDSFLADGDIADIPESGWIPIADM